MGDNKGFTAFSINSECGVSVGQKAHRLRGAKRLVGVMPRDKFKRKNVTLVTRFCLISIATGTNCSMLYMSILLQICAILLLDRYGEKLRQEK